MITEKNIVHYFDWVLSIQRDDWLLKHLCLHVLHSTWSKLSLSRLSFKWLYRLVPGTFLFWRHHQWVTEWLTKRGNRVRLFFLNNNPKQNIRPFVNFKRMVMIAFGQSACFTVNNQTTTMFKHSGRTGNGLDWSVGPSS